MGGNNKQINNLQFIDSTYYYHEHTWVRVKEKQVFVGITDYAQDQLGDLVFIELPSVGDTFKQGDIFGQAESAKTVSSLYMPVSGQVVSVNKRVEDNPGILNSDPYEEGWLIQVEPEELNELEHLLSKESYTDLLS